MDAQATHEALQQIVLGVLIGFAIIGTYLALKLLLKILWGVFKLVRLICCRRRNP